MRKKLVSLIMFAVMLNCLVCITPMAESLTNNSVSGAEIHFYSGGTEIFELPAAGSNVSAKVFFNNNTAANTVCTMILASYAGNDLQNVTLAHETSVIEGWPTLTTGNLAVDANTTKIKMMIWGDMQNLVPIDGCKALTAESGDARIKACTVTIGGNEYKAAINHDLKTMRVFVPTYNKNDVAIEYNKTKEVLASGYTSNVINTSGAAGTQEMYLNDYSGTKLNGETVNITGFNTAVKTAVVAFTLGNSTATVTPAAGSTDLSTSKTYTVTAADGTEETYTLSVETGVNQVSYSFDGSAFGLGATQAMVNEVKGKQDEYKYKKYTSAYGNSETNPVYTSWRLNAPNAQGRSANGDGYWQFNENVAYNSKEFLALAADSAVHKSATDLTATLVAADVNYRTDGNTTDKYFNFINLNPTSGKRGSLKFAYSSDQTVENRKSLITGFDFKVSPYDGTFSGGARFAIYKDNKFPVGGELLLRKSGEQLTFQGRANSADVTNSNMAATGTVGYSTLNGSNNIKLNTDTWYTFKMVSTDMGANADGTRRILSEYYLNNEYVGYAYRNDYNFKLGGKTGTTRWYPTFYGFNASRFDLGIDNFYVLYSHATV